MKISEIQVSYSSKVKTLKKINCSNDVYNLMMEHWNLNTIEMQEEVKVLLLNNANNVLGIYNLSKGGINSAIIDIKLVLSVALKCLATGIILVHNHPSGNLLPSKADKDITKKIKKGCSYLELNLLDHLIITKDDYYSFADSSNL